MTKMGEMEPQGRERPLTKTLKLMARHMVTAWQAPMFDVVLEVDMEAADGRRGDGVTLTDVILSDCAKTLAEHPYANAHWRDDAVIEYDEVNMGLAVAAERGLTVPVIRSADTLSLGEIVEQRRTLVSKVREGSVSVADVTGGTFTLSNLGMYDVKQFTAIIAPPQVAILAVGATVRRQVWNGGDPEWRPICEMTLTCDHRAIDGAQAARFMAALKGRLEGRAPAG